MALANIAEGAMRSSPRDFANFLSIAIGSAAEPSRAAPNRRRERPPRRRPREELRQGGQGAAPDAGKPARPHPRPATAAPTVESRTREPLGPRVLLFLCCLPVASLLSLLERVAYA
ncbi:MAG: four helix bundle protein [Gemmatimonadaceae bacterium]